MREVKFRGKCINEDAWAYGSLIQRSGRAFIFEEGVHVPRCKIGELLTEVILESVGEFTGLKDKNGREIYLNDIAKREFDIWKTDYDYDGFPLGDECIEEGYFIGVVSQTPSGLYVLNKCRKYDVEGNLLKKCSGIRLYAHRCEIIGNIYENPELLKGVHN